MLAPIVALTMFAVRRGTPIARTRPFSPESSELVLMLVIVLLIGKAAEHEHHYEQALTPVIPTEAKRSGGIPW